jgi:serine/threonine-protein kinase
VHVKKLGRYDLVRVLGKGAMGVVYEGRDPNLDRQVAIKTIMVDGLGSGAAEEYEARFRIEARSAARLQHPNIVTVHDSDRDGDTAFLVMEFVQGDDLKMRLDRGERYEPVQALHLVHDLLAALDFAHRQGVIHRDIKPANLLVEPGGRLKLTDFGVARIAGEATRTQGSMIGTLKYMAPEAVQGQKVDSRADLFSAAVVTYQLLTGARPFDGDNDFSIIHQVIGHTPAPPSTLAPGLPPAVDSVMSRAMAKDREERYATAADFWQALREAFAGVDLPAFPAVQVQPRPPSGPAAPAASSRAPTVPGTGITQELELEYWRDVRDSTDPRELEGFLARFPEGIYADLARRRLQRLATPDDPDRTVLRGLTRVPVPAPIEPTATEPVAEARQADAAPESAHPSPPAAPAQAPLPPQGAVAAKPKSFVKWWGVPVLAVAGLALAAALLANRGAGTDSPPVATPAGPAAPAPAASAAGVAAPPSSSSAAVASPAGAAASATSRPAVAARPPARRPAPAPATPAPVASPSPAAPAAAEQARAAEPAPAQNGSVRAQRLVPPGETCKDRFFLAKQFCLQSECSKPGYQGFPACIRLKEEARLRDESRVRN